MTTKIANVLVAGATGYIGGGVMQLLHEKGYWVRALARDKSRLRNEDWCNDIFIGNATDPESIRGVCDGIDVVFSSIGIRSYSRRPTVWDVDYQANMNIVEEAKRAGVKHFVFITVIQAKEMAEYSPFAKARNMVAQAIIDSGMDYNIFEPVGFFNDMAEFLPKIREKGKISVFGDGHQIINPLSSLDLAEEIARVIDDPNLRNTIRPVGGPDKFTRLEVAKMAFEVLGKGDQIKINHISPLKIKLMAWIFRIFNYNIFALFKFFEYIAVVDDVSGDMIGRRHLRDYFENLAKGMTPVEAESKLVMESDVLAE